MAPERNTTEAILNAVRSSVLDVGVRRTTLVDVARRAGVSRMTVYRQFEDVSAAIAELLTRDLAEVLEACMTEATGATIRERMVDALVLGVRRLSSHRLLRRVLDLDPELLLPLVVDRLGATQRAAVELVAKELAEGMGEGSVRPLDPEAAAYAVQLTAQSFVFSSRVLEKEGNTDVMLEELRAILDAYLRPTA